MEKVIAFGKENNLVGILSEPQASVEARELPIILILNSGFVHHVGPLRMSVEISRKLVEKNFRVFRFDLSGIGDSDKCQQKPLSFDEQNMADVAEAIKLLVEKYKGARIIPLGLCTGADLAHRTAVAHDEVVGSILLDGYAYVTPKFYLKRYGPLYYFKRLASFLVNSDRIKSYFSSIATGSSIEVKDKKCSDDLAAYFWKLPDKKEYIRSMEQMDLANKQHLYIYTGGINYYAYENQYQDSLQGHRFIERVFVKYFPFTDHMFTISSHREILIDQICQWLDMFKFKDGVPDKLKGSTLSTATQ